MPITTDIQIAKEMQLIRVNREANLNVKGYSKSIVIQMELPTDTKEFSNADLEADFERIYQEAKSIFG